MGRRRPFMLGGAIPLFITMIIMFTNPALVIGDEVIVVVNGYGSTTRMEMFIVARKIYRYLSEKGFKIYSLEMGEFCTSQEMAGISITLIKTDDEIKKYYDAKAVSPYYRKI